MKRTFPQSALSFTAIDFETANRHRGSACAIGLAKVRNGTILEQRTQLIQPHEEFDLFEDRNTRIHQITPADVANQPTWGDLAPDVMDFVDDDILLAHGAPFDRSVLNSINGLYDVEWPDQHWVDSLALARSILVLGSYSLNFVVDNLGLAEDGFNHHDAGEDAYYAAAATLTLAERAGVSSLDDLNEYAATLGGESRRRSRVRLSPQTQTGFPGQEARYDYSSVGGRALDGEVFVFTGTLPMLSRGEATRMVQALGATTGTSVTKNTTVVVAGTYDRSTLRPGHHLGRKLERAMQLAEEGRPIEIIGADEFLNWIDVETEELEKIVRTERARKRQGWLPGYVVSQARELAGLELSPTEWLRKALADPNPHPNDPRCVRCDGSLTRTHWVHAQRSVCSTDCNEALKRAAKDRWKREGISWPSNPDPYPFWKKR